MKERIEKLEKKLQELKAAYEETEKTPNRNIITQFPSASNERIYINNYWAGSLMKLEREGDDSRGFYVSGHAASLYLDYANGQWYDEGGRAIKGYFYYKPKKD